MLVRPPKTNFKMTLRPDCTVSACSPLPLSVKALLDYLLDRRLPSVPYPHPVVSIQQKANFPPTSPLYGLLSGKQPDLSSVTS